MKLCIPILLFQHTIKSYEIIDEAYKIVQIAFSHSKLVISTTYRAIICVNNGGSKWNISQIGRKDRKV